MIWMYWGGFFGGFGLELFSNTECEIGWFARGFKGMGYKWGTKQKLIGHLAKCYRNFLISISTLKTLGLSSANTSSLNLFKSIFS